jgi:hypothetical protein
MISKLWELTSALFTIAQDLKQYRQEQKEIRNELRDLTVIVHALAQEVKNSKERSAQRHENLLLEVENRLLRAERALPARRAKKASKKKSKK